MLKYLYTSAQLGETPAGLIGFTPVSGKIQNVGVSAEVANHFEYVPNVNLN